MNTQSSSKIQALYGGSFDPVTNGHMDIIKRSLKIFNSLIVLVANNINKTPLFSVEERMGLMKESLKDDGLLTSHIQIIELPKDELLIHAAKRLNVDVLIRGLRASSDFEFEFQWTGMNFSLDETIEILYFPAHIPYQFISSSFVKEVARLHGDVSKFAKKPVIRALKDKFN